LQEVFALVEGTACYLKEYLCGTLIQLYKIVTKSSQFFQNYALKYYLEIMFKGR